MKKMAMVFALALALLVAAVPVLAEAAPSCTEDEYPIVDGSTATLPLSYALMQHITGVTQEEAEACIRHTKTTQSFSSLIYGDADLLLVYAPNEAVYQEAYEMGVVLNMKPIGRDAMVFLINENNPVTNLTEDQVVGIYSGKITNWADVGGADSDIIAYQRGEDSGSQVMMRKQVMKDTPMMPASTEYTTTLMDELVDAVASYKNDSNAIGYSVYYYVHNMYMQEGIRLLNINGITPTTETIANGEYPYTQDFYAVIRADAPADSMARKIYDWLDTEDAKALITAAGYVAIPGTPEEIEIANPDAVG